MERKIWPTLLLLTAGASLFVVLRCSAQEQEESAVAGAIGHDSGAASTDDAAIRAQSVAFVEAFNRGDAKALAALWTQDGEYVDETGRKYEGREAIEKGYAEFFAANPQATLRLEIDSLRLVSDDAAIEDGRAELTPTAGGTPTASAYSVVHVKVDEQWLMASVRDALVDGAAASEHMADLGWLIGSWTSEEHGAKTESVCRWLNNKNFIERTYTTKGIDGAETSGLQIIGWNAQDGHVQSWNFSPDGAFAVGVWSPIDNGWQAAVSGVTADGVSTTATNRLVRLDDNAYVWQSVERSLGEDPLPDTDEVVLRRNSQK